MYQCIWIDAKRYGNKSTKQINFIVSKLDILPVAFINYNFIINESNIGNQIKNYNYQT
ncbi:MAG: hypothetical protein ACEY29_03340 [Arsenophonus sp.]